MGIGGRCVECWLIDATLSVESDKDDVPLEGLTLGTTLIGVGVDAIPGTESLEAVIEGIGAFSNFGEGKFQYKTSESIGFQMVTCADGKKMVGMVNMPTRVDNIGPLLAPKAARSDGFVRSNPDGRGNFASSPPGTLGFWAEFE